MSLQTRSALPCRYMYTLFVTGVSIGLLLCTTVRAPGEPNSTNENGNETPARETNNTPDGETDQNDLEENPFAAPSSSPDSEKKPDNTPDSSRKEKTEEKSGAANSPSMKSIDRRLSELVKTMKQYHNQLMMKDSKIETLQDRVKMLTRKVSELESSLKVARSRKNKLQKQTDTYRKKLRQAESRAEDLTDRNKELQEKYLKVQNKHNRLLSTVREQKEQINTLETRLENRDGSGQTTEQNNETEAGKPPGETAEAPPRPAKSPPEPPQKSTSTPSPPSDGNPSSGNSDDGTPPTENSDDGNPAQQGTVHRGRIITIHQGTIVTNLYGKHGLEPGSILYAVRDGEVVAKLNVMDVFNKKKDQFSFAKPENQSTLDRLSEGLTVQTAPPENGPGTNSKKKRDGR